MLIQATEGFCNTLFNEIDGGNRSTSLTTAATITWILTQIDSLNATTKFSSTFSASGNGLQSSAKVNQSAAVQMINESSSS